MAQIFNSVDGSIVIPMATASIRVQTSNSGNSTQGIVALVGEADAGPDFTLETDLNDNAFGPDQAAAIAAKYKSGPIVDGSLHTADALADENIFGSVNRIIPVKTNVSTKASLALLNYSAATWATVYDKSYGKLGNMIYAQVLASVSEILPTTSSFTWIPAVGTVAVGFRVNGGALVSTTAGANATPAAVQSAADGLAGVLATGGALRTVIPGVAGNLTVTAPGANAIVISYSGVWTTTPSVGDTVTIPVGSAIAGAANATVGSYVVTGATTNSVSATKLSDGGKGGAVIGVITAPAAVGSTPVAATTDFNVYAPLVFTLEAGNPVDGIGKTLEICELTSGTDLLTRAAFALSTTAVTWVSKTGTPKLLTAGAEYVATINVARQVDSLSDTLTAGGEIGLKVSYTGTTATLTITATALTTSVTGGSGANLNLTLSDFPTISDLATYINAQTGYKAAVGTATVGQQAPAALDRVTAVGICSNFGDYNGRIKTDSFRMYQKVSGSSLLIQIGNPATQPTLGLPAPMATVSYLAGGARGATLAATITAALTALERVQCNFVVLQFSRDASADITDGLTDASSTYTISAVHAAALAHVVAMAKIKRRKNRQGFVSIRDTYANAKAAAGNMGAARITVSFLDQKVLASDGTVKQFQPWMDSCIAAGGQAAAGYKALVRKKKNVVGSLQAAGDWNDQDDSAVEDALLAGLLPTRRNPNTGAFYFVSDQTSYSRDSNFVYNSIQAVYVADLIALTTAQRMEDAFCGQSLADISAQGALTFLEGIMADFMRQKWIAPSDDAPLGYRNASVTIQGPAMLVSIEVKLAGALYFIPIQFLVSQVTQTATQQ